MFATMKYPLGVVCGLVCLFLLAPAAHASYSHDFTINPANNAGTLYNQAHYAILVGTDSFGNPKFITTDTITSEVAGGFVGYLYDGIHHNTVQYYTGVTNPITAWVLWSAGDIWNTTSHSHIYQSTGLLAGGTYRISVLPSTDAFTYDSWNWSGNYGYWGWYLHITDNHGHQWTLGPGSGDWASTVTTANKSAFLASLTGLHLDLTLTPGTELYFWIYDNNTLDNAGSLSFNLASVPLPSSLLLVLSGLPAMALFRMRRSIRRK